MPKRTPKPAPKPARPIRSKRPRSVVGGTGGRAKRAAPKAANAQAYRHPEADAALRPEVGTQAQFKKRLPPRKYDYDSSLAPELKWDDHSARDFGEWLIGVIEQLSPGQGAGSAFEFKNNRGEVIASVRTLPEALELLKRLSRPFLNWAGKAERLSFDVPTLPLFIHERLSTSAILETLKGHKRDKQMSLFDLFGDPQRSLTDQLLRAYEHANNWSNRLILGDSLVAMNSLLRYEGLGSQVQMIYMDPPYGVKFGSNFQPFVRKRDVSAGDDEDMTREPEMVKAYRDTWELGLHSYLTYMRDRLLIARDLLTPSGSIFVQIGDENVHHVREVMDEVFGAENSCGIIPFKKTGGQSSKALPAVIDYLLWYAKDKEKLKYRQLFVDKIPGQEGATNFTWIEEVDGTRRPLTADETRTWTLPPKCRILQPYPLFSEGVSSGDEPFEWNGEVYKPSATSHWKTTKAGLTRLADLSRLIAQGKTLRYVNYLDDYPVTPVTNIWTDTQISGFAEDRYYIVQTLAKVIQRCMLMTTDPGDLVLDPTSGSGTTAYVAEEWGRRWITMDVSRVPLALTRQRLLTATYPYYELKDEKRGPAGGFVYSHKQNSKGEEVGGLVPHVTLKSIANEEPAAVEVLVDRPEEQGKITRITGPFTFEATIPTPVDWESRERGGGPEEEGHGTFVERMLSVLRQSPVLHVGGGQTVTLKNIRPPAKTLALSAEAMVAASALGVGATLMDIADEAEEKSGPRLPLSQKPVALVFGPENAAVSEKLVFEAAREAHAKGYTHLFVIGFAIQPNARGLVENCEAAVGVPATYVQATPDLMMGDLLKNMRSSQIFSVCGLPEIKITPLKMQGADKAPEYKVELLGLDVFDPITMEVFHRRGDDVPCWMLDSNYNGLCFRATQVFFPRTGAWEALKKALKGTYEDSVWEHLAGIVSEAFEAGEHGQVAVKVIDDRGNELLVVKNLEEGK